MFTNNELLIQNDPIFELDDFEFLEYIVNQNSQSRNPQGVQVVQELFASKLGAIGAQNQFIENLKAESADLLVSKFKGKTDVTLTTIGHADTVLYPTRSNYFRFEEKGKKIFGPGIADNKSGQLIAIKGIEYFLKSVKDPLLNIQFVSSPNEEIGSPGFHEIFNQLGLETQIAIGFEPAMPDGSIIHSRNGNRWYRLEVEGKSSHSGRAHKGHMNAAHDLCQKVFHLQSQVAKLTNLTMNVGSIEGGHSYNTICSKAVAKIDTRFSTFTGLETLIELFESSLDHLKSPCALTQEISQTRITVDDHCPPLEKTANNTLFVEKYLQIINKIENAAHQSVHCGGAADVNHFSHKSLVAFDGLGAIAENMHQPCEFIWTSSLNSRAKAFGEFLIEIDKGLRGNE